MSEASDTSDVDDTENEVDEDNEKYLKSFDELHKLALVDEHFIPLALHHICILRDLKVWDTRTGKVSYLHKIETTKSEALAFIKRMVWEKIIPTESDLSRIRLALREEYAGYNSKIYQSHHRVKGWPSILPDRLEVAIIYTFFQMYLIDRDTWIAPIPDIATFVVMKDPDTVIKWIENMFNVILECDETFIPPIKFLLTTKYQDNYIYSDDNHAYIILSTLRNALRTRDHLQELESLRGKVHELEVRNQILTDQIELLPDSQLILDIAKEWEKKKNGKSV